jgi:hypothetical protein
MNRENAKGKGIQISVGSDPLELGMHERVLVFDELGARLQDILRELGIIDGHGVLLSISSCCKNRMKLLTAASQGSP